MLTNEDQLKTSLGVGVKIVWKNLQNQVEKELFRKRKTILINSLANLFPLFLQRQKYQIAFDFCTNHNGD